MTFLAEDNSTPSAVNPDLARQVAKKLGLKLKFENTAFDTIIPGIDGGRYDFTATTMSATEERLKVMDMINYLKGGSAVAVGQGQPAEADQRHALRQEHRGDQGLHPAAQAPAERLAVDM